MDDTRLVFRDGHIIEVVNPADRPDVPLHLRHEVPFIGCLAGAHWHPIIEETFTIRCGRMRFRIDRTEHQVGPGDNIHIAARQTHEFWSLTDDVVVDHVISPPGHHREMFETWHALDAAGRTNSHGVPRNPLDLARLWYLQDGYVAGLPVTLQRAILTPLARIAGRTVRPGRSTTPNN